MGKKRFNITGLCVPERHYMVDPSERVEEIRELVDDGAYFVMNRARQYGKTTTLHALAKALAGDYFVVRLDFQVLGSASYKDENTFSRAFASCFVKAAALYEESVKETYPAIEKFRNAEEIKNSDFDLRILFQLLQLFCGNVEKPVVLMIDEIDSAQNNQVFLDFLAQLRNYYLEREAVGTPTFQSVILAGVYDVKNLRRKIRQEEEHKFNSPWNIAAKFKVNMSFTKKDIAGMLEEYEKDHGTGMDIDQMTGLIYDDTCGYPFLVSELCKLMDEEVGGTDGEAGGTDEEAAGADEGASGTDEDGRRKCAWTKEGFLEAERMILTEKNTLFDSMMGKLREYPELKDMLKKVLFTGTSISYNADEPAFDMATMFGFIKNKNGQAVIANRIFETRLYNAFLSSAEMQNMDIFKAAQRDRSQFMTDGHLNMRRILEKFVVHFHDLYGDSEEKFVEDVGRKYFLLYLRPIINGTGNYYVEAQTRDLCRTDVIVDYCGEQFIIEMKVWHGNEYHKRGESQLLEYLDAYHLNKGYMLSFNFNKKKQIGVREFVVNDKILIEAVV